MFFINVVVVVVVMLVVRCHVSSTVGNGTDLIFISVIVFYFDFQDDFDNLRTLCYDSTDVYVCCFSVVSPASFANIASR